MSDETTPVNLDFTIVRGKFYRALQRQLDIIGLLIGGAQHVTESQVHESRGFYNFSPAHGAELNHEHAKLAALDWIQGAFVRDAIEVAGLFLDECLTFCAAVQLGASGEANFKALHQICNAGHIKNHKLHFPEKVATLQRKYSVAPEYAEHALSLNKLRSCLVHRMGKVSATDAKPERSLIVKWISLEMVQQDPTTGDQSVVTELNSYVKAGAKVALRDTEHRREFQVGEQISLTPYEVFSTTFTLWRFGMACGLAVENYARNCGLVIELSSG